jgi:hypothetical protein
MRSAESTGTGSERGRVHRRDAGGRASSRWDDEVVDGVKGWLLVAAWAATAAGWCWRLS